jgi:hypothetical protein
MIAFITARLDEVEEQARKATPGVWKLWGMSVMADQDGTSNVTTCTDVAHTVMIDDAGKPRTFNALHIARHDPPRVLAEVEAHRKMVANLRTAIDHTWQFGEEARDVVTSLAVRLLQQLAALDADHRDYDPAWAL